MNETSSTLKIIEVSNKDGYIGGNIILFFNIHSL